MMNKLSIILECSRIYSLPMTIMSWLVIFTYAVLDSGNIMYGIIALVGISLAHLGANVLDDYFDYKSLIKQVDFNKQEYLKNTQKTKCRYLVSGFASEFDVLSLACTYLGLAGLIGLFFYIKCGTPVLYYALSAGCIILSYSFLSKIRLSEISIGLIYGPLLFGGTYYVMTKVISWETFFIACPSMFMTIVLIYIHTIMDFDFDLKENHKTIANSFNSQLESLVLLKVFLILAYVTPIVFCIFDISDWQVLLTWLTIPLAIDLYDSMKEFSIDSASIPKHKWFHYPMENMERIKKLNAESFMIRMYQSRNLMFYFSLLLAFGMFLATL